MKYSSRELLEELQMDVIYDTVDNLCFQEEWQRIDQLLLDNMEEKSYALRLAWLTTSAWCKQHLSNRQAYVDRTIEIFSETMTPHQIQANMTGLY